MQRAYIERGNNRESAQTPYVMPVHVFAMHATAEFGGTDEAMWSSKRRGGGGDALTSGSYHIRAAKATLRSPQISVNAIYLYIYMYVCGEHVGEQRSVQCETYIYTHIFPHPRA